MIDFRYHLVSLVAVFIALAVGIALGAGPLREGISTTLESEVGQLRAERAELRSQVDQARHRAEAKEEAVETLSETSLAGTLQDVRVGMVVLPGADRNLVDAAETRVVQAGGTVAVMAELDPRWENAAPTADEQTATLEELAARVQDPEPAGGGAPTVSTVLAAALAGADEPGQAGAWLEVLSALEDERQVDVTWHDSDTSPVTDRRPPGALLVVAGGLTSTTATLDPGAATLARRLELVHALAETATPVVVAGPGTEAFVEPSEDQPVDPGADPLVTAVREDGDLASAVSTVDDLESATGQLTAALALAWQLRDDVGHYGLGELAQAAFPTMPPVREPQVPELPGDDLGQPADPQDGSSQDGSSQDGSSQHGTSDAGAGQDPGDDASVTGP